MDCYDRIIRGRAIINSRKFKIPDNICKGYSKMYDNTTVKTQLNNRISKLEYKSIDRMILDGAGQGVGNGGTKWRFISIPMMEVVEEVASGCKRTLPKTIEKWNVYMIGFVDDKRHYVNSPEMIIRKCIIKAIQRSVSSWYELLHFCKGKLETNKCAWCIVSR